MVSFERDASLPAGLFAVLGMVMNKIGFSPQSMLAIFEQMSTIIAHETDDPKAGGNTGIPQGVHWAGGFLA